MEIKTNNIACRIFKEQIDLIQQLPENERAEVLYKAILSTFNQFENQNEIQNENAYVSVSESISVLGKTVYKLLIKNITCREFSSNYGGKRIGAGKKKHTEPEPEKEPPKITNNLPTLENVLEYAREMNATAGCGGFACTEQQATEFYLHYQAQGWRIGNDASTPIRDWKAKLRQWVLKDQKKTTKEPITLKI